MPIYEYQCDKCGELQEALQKISDKPLTKCAHCSGKLHKLVSHSTFHLKGTGWYVTDYAGKNQKNKTKSDNTTSVKKEASGESTTSTTDKAKSSD